METEKLYYQDCHLAVFSARVLACAASDRGWEIILDRTAFYPEGGGQAADQGTLGGVRVLHTKEVNDSVVHICDGPLEEGSRVEGRLDWEGRFHRMQQHTGEHIVSGLIHSRWGFHNTGFHMGGEGITIDFDGVIPASELPWLEAQANRAVWANLPVKCWIPAKEELETLRYRTKKQLPWPVRIVQIPGCDSCACCGVHTAFTGEVGLIKLFSAIPFRGGTRMLMACGGHALQILNDAYRQNQLVSQAFSVPMSETGEGAKRMNEQLAALKFQITGLQREKLAALAESYRGRGDVLCFVPELDGGLLRELGDRIASLCGGRAAVFAGSDGEGYSYCLVSLSGDLRPLGKQLNAALNGRGGGKPGSIQGRCSADRVDIEGFFKSL